jgi:hypothetical protein
VPPVPKERLATTWELELAEEKMQEDSAEQQDSDFDFDSASDHYSFQRTELQAGLQPAHSQQQDLGLRMKASFAEVHFGFLESYSR